MGRGDHPRRTPIYGGALIIAMMLVGLAITYPGRGLPSALRVILYLLALAAALFGVLLTFRDDS